MAAAPKKKDEVMTTGTTWALFKKNKGCVHIHRH